MWRLMNLIMLSCEQATELMSLRRFRKIPLGRRIQLRMHLMVCHYCRRYNKQNTYIDHALEEWFDCENIHPTEHLTEKQKAELSKILEGE